MLRAIVVEDVELIRKKNIDLIKQNCENVAVIAEADSVKSGVMLIRQLLPDLVFLDIEMPDGSGFDLLQELMPLPFKVIFITGQDHYAVRAFRINAMDYLLKPLDPAELKEAVKKTEQSYNKDMFDMKLNNFFSNSRQPNEPQKIILKTAERLYAVSIQDIVRCEADKNYTTFFLMDGQKLLVSNTLKEYDTTLSPLGFFRTHQSHLINMMHFDHYLKSDGGQIVMKDKSKVPLAVRKKEEFLLLLEK